VISDLSNIEDAKAFKRMGLPLTTPAEHRTFAKTSTEQWVMLWNDLGEFSDCLYAFIERKVAPFHDGWYDVFEALADGEPVTIQPINKWPWNPLQRSAP
jgi:hypothetical protein